MTESGLNAESPPLGRNVVSHYNVEAGSKNHRQELIFFKVWFYAGGRRRARKRFLEQGANLLIWGLQFGSDQIIWALKIRGPKCQSVA